MTPFANKLKSHVLVTYGSQTGYGESVAFDIACGLLQRRIPCYLCNISELTFYMKRDEKLFNSIVKEKLLIVLVLSTTGQGEPSDSTREFWSLIFSPHTCDISYLDWHFAVFGLGDSRYKEFNIVARKVRLRLNQLGCTEFYRVGLGDDKHAYGYEAEFDPWLTGLLNCVSQKCVTYSSDLSSLQILPAKYKVVEKPKRCIAGEGASAVKNERCVEPTWSSFFQAQVVENKEMTLSDHFQKVNYLCLKIPSTKSFSPGSCLAIYPQAEKSVVELFILNVLHKQLEDTVVLEKSEKYPFDSFPYSFRNQRIHTLQEHFLHREITLLELFTKYLDISHVPTRSTLHVLAHFSSSLLYREKLLELCEKTAEGKQLYYEFIKAEHRSIAEVLWDFNECVTEMPLEHLLSLFPTIVPRRYSIASAPFWYSPRTWWILHDNFAVRKFPIFLGNRAPLIYSSLGSCGKSFQQNLSAFNALTRRVTQTYKNDLFYYLKKWSEEKNGYQYIDLCVALVIKKTPLLREVQGLCSSYLSRLKVGDTLQCEIKETTSFPLKPLMTSPLLIVSTGTGVAPARSVLQARFLRAAAFENRHLSSLKALNPILCFFGYRHPQKDFLFCNDWKEMSSSMVSLPNPTVYPSFNPLNCLNIFTVIAFSQQNENKKMYVQDALMHYSSKVMSMFSKKGHENLMILVSGKSHPMPAQVIQYLVDILSAQRTSRQTVETMLKEKKKKNQLIFETWGA